MTGSEFGASRLGIIAGTGDIPVLLMRQLRIQKHPFFVLAYQAVTDSRILEDLTGDPESFLMLDSLGQVGAAVSGLKKANVSRLVMAGKFPRPGLKNLRLDAKGAVWMAGLVKNIFGDDATLRFITKKLEKEGMTVLPLQDVMVGLQAPAGALGGKKACTGQCADIHRAFQILDALSSFDVGQCLAIENGYVLGIEAAEGTDALIARCGLLMKEKGKAILVKTAKIGQDKRLDWPVVGPQTLDLLTQNHFAGLAYRAGQICLIDKSSLGHLADKHGLFLQGFCMDFAKNSA